MNLKKELSILFTYFYRKYIRYLAVLFVVWTGIFICTFFQLSFLNDLVNGIVAGSSFSLFTAVGLVLTSFLIPLLNFIGEYSSGLLKRRVEIDLMAEILRSSTRREVDKSEMLARISGDLMNAMGAAYTPFDVAFQLMRFSVYFVLAWHFSSTLALAALPFVAAYLVVVWRLGPKIFKYSALERERYSEVYKWVKETVDGSHSLRRLGVRRLPAPLLAAFNGWLAATKRLIFYLKGVQFGADSIAYAAPQFTIAYGLYLAAQGAATVGAVLAASRAVSLLFDPVAIIISEVASYMQFRVSYRRVVELLDHGEAAPGADGGGEAAVVKAAVFAYGDKVVLSGVDLVLRPGDFVWVRGPSGVGKTTLGKALAGLVNPASGVVEVPRRALYVGNDDYIFDASVYENIDLWEGYDREEAGEAARLAAIDFPLDKNAKELSEGQRQRVLIARALLRRPHLLVLDEVISGLDQQTAERVLSSVRSRVPICVVISHRPVEAEKIVEVGDGRVKLVPVQQLEERLAGEPRPGGGDAALREVAGSTVPPLSSA